MIFVHWVSCDLNFWQYNGHRLGIVIDIKVDVTHIDTSLYLSIITNIALDAFFSLIFVYFRNTVISKLSCRQLRKLTALFKVEVVMILFSPLSVKINDRKNIAHKRIAKPIK